MSDNSFFTVGLSLSPKLLKKVRAQAKKEDRSYSYIVRRAIKRDLQLKRVQPAAAEKAAA